MSTGGEQTGNDAVDAENRHEVAVADSARRYQPKRRLGAVVAAVAAAVITVGGLTFVWLAWLLSGATAVEVDLTRANLVGVDLSGADLRRATQCWLTGADMSKAKLTEARLGSANMTKVNLADAIVSGTDMATVDLAEAKIDDVVHDGVTAWPYAQVSRV